MKKIEQKGKNNEEQVKVDNLLDDFDLQELVGDSFDSKKDPRGRNWMLTIPSKHYTQEDVEKALSAYKYAGQREISHETSYEHFQVVIVNDTQIRFSTLRNKLPKAWMRVLIKDPRAGFRYVTKEDTRVGEPFGSLWEHYVLTGEEPGSKQGQRNDLEDLKRKIREGVSVDSLIASSAPSALKHYKALERYESAFTSKVLDSQFYRSVKTYWVNGKTGVGKTRGVWETFGNKIFRVRTSSRGLFDGYDPRENRVLLFDEFTEDSLEKIGGAEEFRLITDGYKYELSSRYKDGQANYNVVIFLSNSSFDDVFNLITCGKGHLEAVCRRFESGGRFEQIGRDTFIDLDTSKTVKGLPYRNALDDVPDPFDLSQQLKAVA